MLRQPHAIPTSTNNEEYKNETRKHEPFHEMAPEL